MNYKVVYVSPLRRTLMTAMHMFKNHPNKDNIQFKVLPVVTEAMISTVDVASDIFEL